MIIQGKTFDEERALYNLRSSRVLDCRFAGPADGESALKEARDVTVESCSFSLRYPLWHVDKFCLTGSTMDEKTRAALWYATDGRISGCDLGGIKCLRECRDITLTDTKVVSAEFGWKCRGIRVTDCDITSEYIFLDSSDLHLTRLNMKGKYSYQYTENVVIENSFLDTKDAFWHAKNVTVKNSTVKGEYLGWYSDGLTLINCRIIGTQPLCYCKDLTLTNCTMEGTDLAFEYSDVQADVKGEILSVKNPRSGHITADAVGEIIFGDAVMECTGEVHIR